MNVLLKRLSTLLAVLVVATLSMIGSVPMSASAHTAMMNTSDSEHALHLPQAPQAIQKDHTVSTTHRIEMASCVSLCQVSTTTRPEALQPILDKEEDDEYEETIENKESSSYCDKVSFVDYGFIPRQPKVPLYIKHCSLII
jgi:hypothetical protein